MMLKVVHLLYLIFSSVACADWDHPMAGSIYQGRKICLSNNIQVLKQNLSRERIALAIEEFEKFAFLFLVLIDSCSKILYFFFGRD